MARTMPRTFFVALIALFGVLAGSAQAAPQHATHIVQLGNGVSLADGRAAVRAAHGQVADTLPIIHGLAVRLPAGARAQQRTDQESVAAGEREPEDEREVRQRERVRAAAEMQVHHARLGDGPGDRDRPPGKMRVGERLGPMQETEKQSAGERRERRAVDHDSGLLFHDANIIDCPCRQPFVQNRA